jgi:intermediate cleaving peptidase 55
MKTLYPHNIGHHLGLDLHDCEEYSASTSVLQPGNVITIEPGIYVPYDNAFPEK